MLITISQEQGKESLAKESQDFLTLINTYPMAILPFVFTNKIPGLFRYWIAFCFRKRWTLAQPWLQEVNSDWSKTIMLTLFLLPVIGLRMNTWEKFCPERYEWSLLKELLRKVFLFLKMDPGKGHAPFPSSSLWHAYHGDKTSCNHMRNRWYFEDEKWKDGKMEGS